MNMKIRYENSIVPQPGPINNTLLIAGLVAGSCLLGIAVTAGASDPWVQLLLAIATGTALMAGVVSLALDIPLISLVRAGFILSFFFKLDMNLLKVDEIEDPSGLNISITLVFALILLFYDKVTDDDRERVFTSPLWYILVALFVTATASVALAGAPALGVFSLFSLASSILIAYAAASHFGRKDRIHLLITLLGLGVFFTGVVALVQFATQWPLELPALGTGTEDEHLGTQTQSLGRVPALLRTPTEMAWVISSLVPLVAAPILFRVKTLTAVDKIFLVAAALSATVAVILSLARGSWIGLVTAAVLLTVFAWFRLSKDEKRSYILSLATAGVLIGIVLLPFSGRIYERLTEDDQGAAAIRIPLMQNALLMIEDNAVVGVGLSGYRSTMMRYDETGMFVSTVFGNPVHNIFAHITAETGIFGGILFSILLLYGIIEAIRAARSGDRLIAALSVGAAICIIAFIISGVKEPGSLGSARPPMRTCFLLIGVIMALSRIMRLQERSRRETIHG